MTQPEKQQSSPASTGPLGGNFETRVQAAFAVLMLTGRVAPCLPQGLITKLKLQGHYANFNVDDIVVFTEDFQTGKQTKLLAQIKHEISITKSDKNFDEVIQAAWNDFNNPDIFTQDSDAIALITGPLTSADTNHVRPILEWARTSENEDEFFFKVNKEFVSSDTKKAKLKAFQFHLQNANGGEEISKKRFWEFLKHFHLIGYDLDSETSVTRSLLQSLISQYSEANASTLWNDIVIMVQSFDQTIGTLTLENIPEAIRNSFDTKKNPHLVLDLKKLNDHGKFILNDVKSKIGDVHITRKELFNDLIEKSEENGFVIVVGKRGSGKSSLVREYAEYLDEKIPVFCLRTEDLDKPHLDQVFTAIGLTSSLSDLAASIALMPKKYLLIESLEKLLELQNKAAFTDLIQFTKRYPDWTIIASCREYAFQQISFSFLKSADIECETLVITGFSDDDISYLCETLKILKPIADNPSLKQLLKNPFFAELAYRVTVNGKIFTSQDGEREFRTAVWRYVISKESERSDGMPLRRRRAFIDIAVKRAKRMVYEISSSEFDANAVLKLEDDNLIRLNPSNSHIRPDHDVFEDWAIVEYIDEKFHSSTGETKAFLDTIGHEPAMNRAFRLWLNQKLEDGADIKPLILSILNDEKIERIWQDETITAVLQGQNPLGFLRELRDQLFTKDNELLKRFCFILRIACKVPNQELLSRLAIKKEISEYLSYTLILKPYGPGWDAVIHFLFIEKQNISKSLLPHISAVLEEWSSQIQIGNELPTNSREVGLLALHLLNEIKNSYGDDAERRKFLNVIIRVVPTIQNEFKEMLDADLFLKEGKEQKLHYIDDLVDIALMKQETRSLCKYAPDAVINIAWHEWIKVPSEDDDEIGYGFRDAEECFGLDKYKTDMEFFPPSGLKGPFSSLLQFHPKEGLDFILGFLNTTADNYAHSEFDDPEKFPNLPDYMTPSGVQEVEIILNDGTKIKQYCSERLWFGYRGHEVIPYILQCALMAFENWMIDLVTILNDPVIFEALFNKVLRQSNSVMPTAILASIATGFPDKLGNAALPILRTPEFYTWDSRRAEREEGDREGNLFDPRIDPLAQDYADERRKSALRPWRKNNIEHLALHLQLTNQREKILKIIDDLRSKVEKNEEWRARFHRIDSRDMEPVIDEKNHTIILVPQHIEQDLIEAQENDQKIISMDNRFSSLFFWANKILKNEPLDREYYSDWRAALEESKNLLEIIKNAVEDNSTEKLSFSSRMFSSGLIKAAVVFLRDHRDEMEQQDLSWCVILVAQAIISHADSENESTESTDMNGGITSASILPLLLDYAPDDEGVLFIKDLLAIALTQRNIHFRTAAANGVRNYLWQRDFDFAQNLLNGAIEFAKIELENRRDYNISGDSKGKMGDFRKQLVHGVISPGIDQISFEHYWPQSLLIPCLMIPSGSTDKNHNAFLFQMLTLIAKEEHDDTDNHNRKRNNIRMDYNLPIEFGRLFADYLLNSSEIDTKHQFEEQLELFCDTAPNLVKWILTYTFVSADKTKKQDSYWELWKQLSGIMQKIAVKNAKNQYQSKKYENDLVKKQHKLIRDMLFSDLQPHQLEYEKENLIHGKELIIGFLENAGVNFEVFEAATKLIFHYPDIFFESGIKILSKHQKTIGGTQLLTKNAAFYLEMCINRFLNGAKTSISKEEYRSCQILLDALVDTGSSGAYYLREHMVRSRKINT